ncbi:TolC family protein, partial [Nostoc cycadae]|uniref:TolC family protein n=1 Tax=Nostoc cycadae TaxID=246795 RepID=UPI001FE282E8
NPFRKPNIDEIIEKEFNDDLWRLLRGGLPCLETSAVCLEQLQTRAVTQSPLLKEIDARIAEANQRIAEAKARNKKSIQLSILTPGLQYLLSPQENAVTQTGQQPRRTGIIENIAGIISGDTSIINGLLNVIGVPLFQGLQGGNADAQRNAIAIGDIQVKVAELQRSRAQLADQIRGKVAESLVKFDEARVDYQTAQIVATRATDQFKVFEARYTRGNSDTETYLSRLNQLDNQKAQTYRAWAKMRRSLFELKLLVLSVKDAEI